MRVISMKAGQAPAVSGCSRMGKPDQSVKSRSIQQADKRKLSGRDLRERLSRHGRAESFLSTTVNTLWSISLSIYLL